MCYWSNISFSSNQKTAFTKMALEGTFSQVWIKNQLQAVSKIVLGNRDAHF